MKLAILVVLLVTLLALPALAVDYVLTDLGRGEAFGINDLGQITGWRPDPNGGPSKAFLWSKELGFADIGPSTGRAINNNNQVAGDGWIWSQEEGLTFLSLPTGVTGVASAEINSSGQIVGWVKQSSGSYDAILWNSPTDFVNLGIWDNPNSWAYDINQHGNVVGEFWPSPGENHGFLWGPSSGFTDLGDFGTTFTRADGINDLGQIVGTYEPNGFRHAFLWSAANGLLDLGTLSGGHHSSAHRINNQGQVIGNSMYVPGDPDLHAFVWNQTNGMLDLGLLGGTMSKATDINDKGEIVGLFHDKSGLEHIALWQPVPEPSTFLALCGGITGFLFFHRRR